MSAAERIPAQEPKAQGGGAEDIMEETIIVLE
jgi:hypothetical protein